MTEPSSTDKNREDLPFIWHESEFDVAADLGIKDTVPTGEFTRCEHIFVLSEFDCSQPSEKSGQVALRLTFHLRAGEPSPSLARDVAELLYALHEYDKALGGKGLGQDRAASRAGDKWLSVVLWPNDQQGAADRFRQMAEQLGSPLCTAQPQTPNGSIANDILTDVAAHWEQAEKQRGIGAARMPDLKESRDRVDRYGVQLVLETRAA